MQKVIADITMSLDGFIAGENISEFQPMGIGGQRLHKWIFDRKTTEDGKILGELVATSGAVITGNHTYRTAINGAWDGASPFNCPAFVICHQEPNTIVPGFTFIADGIKSALEKAKLAAGGKNVWVMGGANIVQQFIKAGLADELHIHITQVLLGKGTRLFEHISNETIELENIFTFQSKDVTHLRYLLKNRNQDREVAATEILKS